MLTHSSLAGLPEHAQPMADLRAQCQPWGCMGMPIMPGPPMGSPPGTAIPFAIGIMPGCMPMPLGIMPAQPHTSHSHAACLETEDTVHAKAL